jgi:RNA polymerase sigma-70 factor (ECF subfamily)
MDADAEADLVARCRKGDAAAWDEMFDRHYAATGRFVFQFATDLSREDVEEICQEVFLSAVGNIESFRGGSRLQTWLFRIAVNKAHDYRERKQAVKRGAGQITLSLQDEDPETGLALDPPSPVPPPDLALLNAEHSNLVHDALAQLARPCREIIELRYFGELSYDEIGVTLELNPKTVSSRLSKCLDRLETTLRKTFAGENSTAFPSNL